jgi:hypothetical protein
MSALSLSMTGIIKRTDVRAAAGVFSRNARFSRSSRAYCAARVSAGVGATILSLLVFAGSFGRESFGVSRGL